MFEYCKRVVFIQISFFSWIPVDTLASFPSNDLNHLSFILISVPAEIHITSGVTIEPLSTLSVTISFQKKHFLCLTDNEVIVKTLFLTIFRLLCNCHTIFHMKVWQFFCQWSRIKYFHLFLLHYLVNKQGNSEQILFQTSCW